jgi:hypothetical protein
MKNHYSSRDHSRWASIEKSGIGYRVSTSCDGGLIVETKWFVERKDAAAFAKKYVVEAK